MRTHRRAVSRDPRLLGACALRKGSLSFRQHSAWFLRRRSCTQCNAISRGQGDDWLASDRSGCDPSWHRRSRLWARADRPSRREAPLSHVRRARWVVPQNHLSFGARACPCPEQSRERCRTSSFARREQRRQPAAASVNRLRTHRGKARTGVLRYRRTCGVGEQFILAQVFTSCDESDGARVLMALAQREGFRARWRRRSVRGAP